MTVKDHSYLISSIMAWILCHALECHS